MKRYSEPLKVKVTVGLWWRWQDLNLRPWDYDAPALPPNHTENLGFLKREKPKGETFGRNILLIN